MDFGNEYEPDVDVGADEQDLTAPEIAPRVPDPAYVNPHGDPTVPAVIPEKGVQEVITDAISAATKWVSEHPVISFSAGFLVIGYFIRPRWAPWSMFMREK